MRVLSSAVAIVRRHRRAYLACNVGYYGLILVGLAWAQMAPKTAEGLRSAVASSLESGALAPIADVYDRRAVLAAIGLTLAVNLIIGSLASITLPSLVLPFCGLAVAGFRALVWGLLFSPESAAITWGNLPQGAVIAGVLILEGQGYVLTMLAAWIHGIGWTRPATSGATTHGQGFRLGLGVTTRLYGLVVLTLAVAAVFEVVASTIILPGVR
jgi:hypothetical protein